MMMAGKRERTFREALKGYPVVAVFEPRQSGKTTFAEMRYYEFILPEPTMAETSR